MANLGFEAIELEGVREKNLREVYENRERQKGKCQEVGAKVVNFCPVLPDIVNLNEEKRKKALKLLDLDFIWQDQWDVLVKRNMKMLAMRF